MSTPTDDGNWVRTRSASPQAEHDGLGSLGPFDAVLDFDAVWRDPDHPTRIRQDFHSDDHLHGNDTGYRALADSVDLSLFS